VFACETVDDVFNKIICSRKGNGFIKINDFLSGTEPLRKTMLSRCNQYKIYKGMINMNKNKLIDFSGPSKDPKVNHEINSIKSEQCFMCKNIQDQLGKDYWSFDGYLE